jgi:hypothetical protein
MKAKTIVELAALTSSFYAITKDKEMREDVIEMIMKGKEKLGKTVSSLAGEDNTESVEMIIGKLFLKAKEIKEEVEQKIEEVAEKVYHKMHIANIHEIENLQKQIDELRSELLKQKV